MLMSGVWYKPTVSTIQFWLVYKDIQQYCLIEKTSPPCETIWNSLVKYY